MARIGERKLKTADSEPANRRPATDFSISSTYFDFLSIFYRKYRINR